MSGIMNIQTARKGSYMQRTQGGTKSSRKGGKASAKRQAKAADKKLDNFIKSNQNLKNQSTLGSILSTVSDAPQKFGKNKESRKEFVERQIKENDGRINSAAQAVLDFYNDGRNDYQRGLNTLRTSSPEMDKAYAKRFPISNFAMKMGPVIAGAATGIPFGLMDYLTKTKDKAAKGINTLSERGDVFGAIARTGQDIMNSLTPEQAKNISINIQDNQPIDKLLRDQNIINASKDVDPILRAANAQTGTENIMDIFDPEKAAIDASLPTGDIVYNPYNSNPYSPGSREYNEFEQFKKFKESQEEVDDSFEGVEDGAFQRAGEFKLEADEPSVNLSGVTDYEEEFEDTFGVPMKGNIEAPSLTRPGEIERGLGDRLTRETFALDNNVPLDQLGELYPKVTTYPYRTNERIGEITPQTNPGDFNDIDFVRPFFGLQDDPFSEKISDGPPALGQEIRSADFSNLQYKDGGSTDNYGNMSTHEKLMRMASKMYG